MTTSRNRPTLRMTLRMTDEAIVLTIVRIENNQPHDISTELHITAREKVSIHALLTSSPDKFAGFWPSNPAMRDKTREKLVRLLELGYTYIYAHGWGGPQIRLKWAKSVSYKIKDSSGVERTITPDEPYYRMRMSEFGDYPSAVRNNLAFLEMVGLRAHKARYGEALQHGYVSDDIFRTPDEFITNIPKPLGPVLIEWVEEVKEWVSK